MPNSSSLVWVAAADAAVGLADDAGAAVAGTAISAAGSVLDNGASDDEVSDAG